MEASQKCSSPSPDSPLPFYPDPSRFLISLTSAFHFSSLPRPPIPLAEFLTPPGVPAKEYFRLGGGQDPTRGRGGRHGLGGSGKGHGPRAGEKVVTSAGLSPRWRGGTPKRPRPRASSPNPLWSLVLRPAPGRDSREGRGIAWNLVEQFRNSQARHSLIMES